MRPIGQWGHLRFRRLVAGVLLAAGCADDGPTAMALDVEVRAAGCSLVDQLASGVVIADGYVLTVAHVVRGATTVSVEGASGVVVAVDHRIDAAIIAVATHGPAVASLGSSVASGPATVDGRPVRVDRRVVVSIDEPIDGETYRRRALVIDGRVGHGDSGSGVLGSDGALLGMVFAASRRQPSVAYAVASGELGPFISTHVGSTGAADLGACR